MNDYQQRTVTRLLRHVEGVTVEKPTPTSMHYVVTINGVPARAMVGDGFLTFGVRPDRVLCSRGWLERAFDGGIDVVSVRKMERDRTALTSRLLAVHSVASAYQWESAERAANYFSVRAPLTVEDDAT